MLRASVALLMSLALPAAAAAQPPSGGTYVNHEDVNAALARSGVLIAVPQVTVAGVHRDTAGALETQKATAVFYVTDGEATLVAGGQSQRLTKGDAVVVPAGTPHLFRDIAGSISYYLVTVPVLVPGGSSAVTFLDRARVAATLKKAGPLADGPNLIFSGGYRTGPYAPDYRPDVEVHANEADLFYVIDGRATQVTGGTMIGGRATAPGQTRGARIEGGQTNHLTQGDVMWVPAGMPHWFPEIPQALSYLLVKVLR
jgi:quercetin dioxygenase-like cupin family protein